MDPVAFVPLSFFLFFLLLVAAMAFVVVLGIRANRRRTAAFAAEAARLGLAFEEKSSEGLPQRYRGLAPFRKGKGSNPRAMNVLRGTYRGWDVRFFDYLFVVSTGKSTTTVWYGVALVRLGESWPELSAVPETLDHKLWDFMGGDDIDFESAEFSRRFWVKSEDRKFAYDVFHPRAMELLLSAHWGRWHVLADTVCLWNPKRAAVADVQPALDALVDLIEMVPRFARPARPRVAVLANPGGAGDTKNNR